MKWDRGVRCQFRFELVNLSASKPIRLLQTLTFILYREGGRVSSISFGHATYDLQRGQVQHKPRLARGRAAGRDSARFCFPGVQIQSAAHFARSLPWAEVAVVWCQFGRAVESVAVLGGGRDPGDTLAPFSVGYIKGWRRSVACLAVAEAIKALDILEEVSAQYKACWRPSGGVCVCVRYFSKGVLIVAAFPESVQTADIPLLCFRRPCPQCSQLWGNTTMSKTKCWRPEADQTSVSINANLCTLRVWNSIYYAWGWRW